MSVGKAAAFFFILAFVGNQVDNMWGSFIFATPMVYASPFFGGMTTEIVRGLFVLSPFAYPAIRLVQAFIAMLIAVPLMQTLQGTPWLWSRDNILTGKDKKQDATVQMAPVNPA